MNAPAEPPHSLHPRLGLADRFAPQQHEAVEQAASGLRRLGITDLRLEIGERDDEWLAWLLPRLASEFTLLPVVPAEEALALAERFGSFFEWIELPLANETMPIARRCRSLGKHVVLATPADPDRIERLAGLFAVADAVMLTEMGTATPDARPAMAAQCRALFARQRVTPELWLRAGPQPGGHSPVRDMLDALSAPIERLFWTAPLHRESAPCLPARLLAQGGVAALRDLDRLVRPAPALLRPAAAPERPVLITGGAGFVGTNLASRLASQGRRVLVLDNLARPGVERNLAWLRATYGDAIQVELADLGDAAAVRRAVGQARAVFHFAAQVAVTTSLVDPVADFDTNARGTLVLLEALRALAEPVPLVFTSTNKVYGKLGDIALETVDDRWQPVDPDLRARGIDEERPLDFYSPYGCSKGTADQYVLDYARTYDLPATVFRMSCIYGPHQFGTEDQGWVAHFLISALEDRPITLYGDGKQVRDVLYVDDLVDALLLANERIDAVRGQKFNIGGGPENATSLLELLARIGDRIGRAPQVGFGPWRPGDQLYYVSDTTRFQGATGWRPKVGIAEGLDRLARWLIDNRLPERANPIPRKAAS